MAEPLPTFAPAGDAALLVSFGDAISQETNRRVHALAHRLLDHPIPGLGEVVPAYTTLLVNYDPLLVGLDPVIASVRSLCHGLDAEGLAAGRLVEVPTFYGGAAGPDLEFVARSHEISPEEVVRIHSQTEYQVYLVGFTPGFAYMGIVEERIATPRQKTPRERVPAGSVGIAGSQTGIYPLESPGGWQVIGRTPLKLFDPAADPPCLFSPGDRVRFVPISAQEAGGGA